MDRSASPPFLRQQARRSIALAGTVASFASENPYLKAPMASTSTPIRSKRVSVTRAQRVLASFIVGAGVDEIGAAERLTGKRRSAPCLKSCASASPRGSSR